MILGGGINGAAIARELVLNGTNVVLVDSADLASGATAYSSRLIHGGLRYLEYGEFDLVRESLAERTRLLALAPQFVRPLQLFIPVERRWGGMLAAALQFGLRSTRKRKSKAARGLWLVRLGLWLYDRYARGSGLPRPTVSRVGGESLPPVDAKLFRWLCSYYDAQILYPERFVLALLADAKQLAAVQQTRFDVFTHCRAELQGGRVVLSGEDENSMHPSSSRSGTRESSEVSEVVRLPLREPAEFEPAAIINATGAWVDHTLARLAISSRRLIGGTKGSHFVTSHGRLREALGGHGIYAEAADGRPFFILPLGSATLVGTTDLPFEETPDKAIATDEELVYLLSGVERVFPAVKLTRDDIDFHYSGVRPLPFVSQTTPGAITRRHWLEDHPGSAIPLYSVIGGKLTTCRSLAEEVAAAVLARLGLPVRANSRARLLPGAEGYPATDMDLAQAQQRIAAETGNTLVQVQAVWPLLGTRSAEFLRDEQGHPFSPADRKSVAGCDYPRGFVRRVIREEWAIRLADLVERRLMLRYERRLSVATLRELAELLYQAGCLAEEKIEPEVQACLVPN